MERKPWFALLGLRRRHPWKVINEKKTSWKHNMNCKLSEILPATRFKVLTMEQCSPKTCRKLKHSRFTEKLFAVLFPLSFHTLARSTALTLIGLSLPIMLLMTLLEIRIQCVIVVKTKHVWRKAWGTSPHAITVRLSTLSRIIINNIIVVSDIPVSVSLPHFYNSDPSLVHEVEGINPIKEKHESIIIMQPVSRCLMPNDPSVK